MASRESSNGGLNPAAAGVPDLSSHAPDTVYRPVQRQFSNIGGGTKEKARPRSVVTGVRKPDCTAGKAITEPHPPITGDTLGLTKQRVVYGSKLWSAANQKIQNPAMPGLKFDLVKMSGNGAGETTIDLAQLLPAKGTVDSHSELSMAMNTGAQKQTITMKMDLNLRLETK